jgi:hypothetical protein
MTTYPKFRLTIGYRSWLIDAASAAKVMDVLAAAIPVGTDWVDGETVHHVLEKDESLSLEQVTRRVLTPVEYDIAYDAAEAAKVAKKAKEAAEQEA